MNRSNLIVAIGCVALLAGCASYPPDAHPIDAKALHERLAGKTYTARTATGMGWEMRYGPDGRLNMELSNGDADKGRWRAEEGRLCIDFEGKFPSGCSEVRADAKQLYFKRGSNNEIVVLTVKP